jgi:hypothetical protein
MRLTSMPHFYGKITPLSASSGPQREPEDVPILDSPACQELTQDFLNLPAGQTVRYEFDTTGQTATIRREVQGNSHSRLILIDTSGIDAANIDFEKWAQSWVPVKISPPGRAFEVDPARDYLRKLFKVTQ